MCRLTTKAAGKALYTPMTLRGYELWADSRFSAPQCFAIVPSLPPQAPPRPPPLTPLARPPFIVITLGAPLPAAEATPHSNRSPPQLHPHQV